ncbi:hypothetical protein VE02_07793 [Pseudogymnoascus sp. 03VT05]|nr:hypothetical protein VE02_07793 [Pseudogymnoascus sp. 03VT05]
MIWYFLYPFRGTTEPPSLSPAHPLRRSFTRYGREASRHPVITILISVALATCLIYPFPFLYTNNFTNGASNLPHHVWTAAQPIEENIGTEPDVVMRSIWVHGSYMKALRRDVLLAGLEIQDALLGQTINFDPKLSAGLGKPVGHDAPLSLEMRDSFHAINGLSEQSWFFHSPLLYWSCSPDAVTEDDDIVSTINESSRRSTSVNVTLRHSIVFSGKRFEDHRLVAADALVITLVHKLDSPVGRQWERQAQALAQSSNSPWRMYPRDGRVNNSQVYEFKFQPLSLQDDIFLAIAYIITVIYFLLSLTKLRALKSRFGLMLAVVAQTVISIMGSFTICAILKIDLSRIPREVYPFVVVAVGLENMFRLVNAVIITPSQSKTSSRIAEALGQAGPIALAGVGQDLLILYLLSKVVAPGVAAFCIFAAVALIFDFVLLLTFFVAVLSVDVRRTELSDSLETVKSQRKKLGAEKPKSTNAWLNAVLSGKTPISTRIAGTIVMICFILVLQGHFFNNESPLRTLSRALQFVRPDHQLSSPHPVSQLSVDINQARSPTAWLRMQDHETAREVIQVIKPDMHSYIARVYDPLVFVLDSSDRTPTNAGVRRFLPAAYDFARNQSTIFVVSVLIVVAAVSLLMNYLLWNEEDTSHDDDGTIHKEDPLMTVTTLTPGHDLDVVMLSASPDGVVVSVGLDRRIRVWDLRQNDRSHYISPTTNELYPFPILAMAIDEQAEWVALLSVTGRLMLWNINEKQWGPSGIIGTETRAPPLFSFKSPKLGAIASLLIVWTSGSLIEVNFHLESANQIVELQPWEGLIPSAKQFVAKPTTADAEPSLHIVVLTTKGTIHLASQLDDKWDSLTIPLFTPSNPQKVKAILPLPKIGLLLAITDTTAILIHISSQETLHTFTDLDARPQSLQCFHSVKRSAFCGHNGLASFSLAYNSRSTGNPIVRTYSPSQDGDLICTAPSQPSSNPPCNTWTSATLTIHKVPHDGAWQALPCGAIVGVTKHRASRPSSPSDSPSRSSSASGLRHRAGTPRGQKAEETDGWEAWTLSARGERHSVDLAGEGGRGEQLFVTGCETLARVGRRSVAVGFGNMVKVVMVGNERFEGEEGAGEVKLGRRRRGGRG